MGLGKTFKKAVGNVGKVVTNFVKDPIGTTGAVLTNPIAAQAAIVSGDKGTQAVLDYSQTDLAKGLGYTALAAGALAAGGAFAPEAVGAPMAAEGAITTGGAANVVPMGGAMTTGAAAAGGWGLTDSLLAASLGMEVLGGYQQNQAAKQAKKAAEQQAAEAKVLADQEAAYYQRLEDKAREETEKAVKQANATKNNMSRGLSDLLWGNNLLGVVPAADKKKAVLG